MPPLICFSPDILDQSFPRSEAELSKIQKSLAAVTRTVQEDRCLILLTQVLSDFIEELKESFCWEVMEYYPEVRTIYDTLIHIGLQQYGVFRVDLEAITTYTRHPIPESISESGFTERWSIEVGRLWTLHSQKCSKTVVCIGIACTSAFAGEEKGKYANAEAGSSFPLVGPEDLNRLDDLYMWKLPANIGQRKVSFREARKNIVLLGGSVEEPKGSSHYQVRFSNGSKWSLDINVDPVPERFLKELIPMVGLNLDIIKCVLTHGYMPPRVPRL